jgi:uncharacterized protein
MKRTKLFCLNSILALGAGLALTAAAQTPRKILVVTTTLGFRHSSIPIAEKVLGRLAQQSGAFTVDYAQQPTLTVKEPQKPKALKDDAPEEARQKHKEAQAKWEAENVRFQAAQAVFLEDMKKTLERLSPENLKNYDGVVFANTTGDLPIPDRDGFLAWLKSGKAFVGMHSCSDTFHGWPAFIKMLGGEFQGHGAQAGVECLNQDPKHPANLHLPNGWKINQEEIYLMRNYDLEKCNHDLLVLDKHPNKPEQSGRFPISWSKEYGQGRVFYTSLGHREDVWDETWTEGNGKRANTPEMALAYQQHILGGLKWALGLAAEAKP